jgi:carbon starvation protein
MASIFGSIPGFKGLMPYWYNFALMFEALFILTTVDTGTRVARFLIQEFGGSVYAPLRERAWKPGIILTSLIVVIAWGYLIYSGNISTIWPMFGVANQLLAAIALGVGTTIILKTGRIRYALVTFIPMAFMFAMTFTASWQLTGMFLRKIALTALPSEVFSLKMDVVLLVLMAILAAVALGNMLHRWHGLLFRESSARPDS